MQGDTRCRKDSEMVKVDLKLHGWFQKVCDAK